MYWRNGSGVIEEGFDNSSTNKKSLPKWAIAMIALIAVLLVICIAYFVLRKKKTEKFGFRFY